MSATPFQQRSEMPSQSPQPMPQVYIAYSYRDGREFVEQLYRQLQRQGFKVWEYSKHGVRTAEWHRDSQDALRNAFVLIVVCSRASVTSENVAYEWSFATEMRLPIIPLIISPGVQPPMSLEQWQSIDFTRPDAAWPQLVQILYRFLDRREIPYQQSTILAWRKYITQQGAKSDQVEREDQLEFSHYVTAFVELIRSPFAEPPLTIGIYGSWGMGKSFLLESIVRKLTENPEPDDTKFRIWERPFRKFGRRLRKAWLNIWRTLWLPVILPLGWCWARWQSIRVKWFDQKPPMIQPTIHIVQFNAWEYSATEVIWPGLVRKIMDRLEKETGGIFQSLFFTKLMRSIRQHIKQFRGGYLIASIVIIFLLALVFRAYQLGLVTIDERAIQGIFLLLLSGGLFTIFKVLSDAIRPMGDWVTKLIQERDYGKQVGYMEEIRLDLEFLEKRLQRRNGRILIIIDDLDRCEPEKAVEMLQAIKLLLNFKSFIVILGIDSRIITKAVEKHYQGLLGPAGASGYEYLDKIVQIPFRIPEPTPDEIKGFLTKQMGFTVELSGDTEQATASTNRTSSRERLAGVSLPLLNVNIGSNQENRISNVETVPPNPIDDAPEPGEEITSVDFTPEEQQAFVDMAIYLRPNPRHIKRIMNVYRLVRELAKSKERSIPGYQSRVLQDPVAAIRWLVICGQWPYTAFKMLEVFREVCFEQSPTGETVFSPPDDYSNSPDQDLLVYIHYMATRHASFNIKRRDSLDYDPEKLENLLWIYGSNPDKHNWMDWEELYEMQRYTINFNPAIESEAEDVESGKANNKQE